MTSSVTRRGAGSSFTIADLIGTDEDSDAGGTGNHDNDNNNNNNDGGGEVTRCSLGVAAERDCPDIRQVDWQRQISTGAFQVYRPSTLTNNNFYQACLNWMRTRGTIQPPSCVKLLKTLQLPPRGGYVFIAVRVSVCLSVCLSVCVCEIPHITKG